MILRWSTGESAVRYQKRGGSGYGITTTASSPTSYGAGPPSSTYSRWHGKGSQPEIAGSTGGFIGLISVRPQARLSSHRSDFLSQGVAAFVIIATLAGLYLRNRYKKRLPKQAFHPAPRTKPTLPSLSISRPSSDPYAVGPSASQMNDTPTATSGSSFARPMYSRHKSSEWDLPLDSAASSGRGTPRKEGYGDLGVDMPEEPGEAAWPLRSVQRRPSFSPHKGSFSSAGSGDDYEGKGKGKLYDPPPAAGSFHNPFDSPFDEASPAHPKVVEDDTSTLGGRSPLLRPESAGESGEELELEKRTPRIRDQESGRLEPSEQTRL
ncbi:hypothetical protein L202_05315 [Cryptococcus amylolentus CBS 6039]|uniref:Uncharacterized protein n=1 Tax=Cryptococcus amylolentus CBS 6039 TaxID=1295533 RepID=A0A1E3HK12_9TREE|nr:hypothetical protein L202_05315 [Cryptococcus amylolentus CBS 6039]ODN76674.1 hypothetical protein L202_05315 [Cryptococcus amylolentus CBS 6039]